MLSDCGEPQVSFTGDYRGGKVSALGSLVGMIMKSGKGLNAKLVQEQLKKKLS